MIPAFVKRMSKRLGGSSDSESNIVTLSKKDTLQLPMEQDPESKKCGSIAKKKSTLPSLKRISLSKKTTLVLSKSNSSKSSSSHSTTSKKSSISSRSGSVGPAALNTSSSSKLNQKAASVTKSRLPEKRRGKVELWFYRGEFVSIRADETGDNFFICRLLQNVYNNSGLVRIKWAERYISGKMYVLTSYEMIDPASIVMSIRLVSRTGLHYKLDEVDITESKRILKMIINKDINGITDDEVLTVEQIEPPVKKCKVENQKGVNNKRRDGGKKEVEMVDKKEGKRKRAKKEDLTLKPRAKFKVMDKDPLFETRTNMPYVSLSSYSMLAFRTVILNDVNMFISLQKVKGRKLALTCRRSLSCEETSLYYAIKNNNREILDVLLKDHQLHVICEQSSRRILDTGRYNYRSLELDAIRPITASRGVKEGDEAFYKDIEEDDEINSHEQHLKCAMKHGVEIETLELLLKHNMVSYGFSDLYHTQNIHAAACHIDVALTKGYRKIISVVIEKAYKDTNNFNKLQLYSKVLMAQSAEELKGQTPPSSVMYQARQFKKMSPIHFAAVNPKVEILEKLLSVNPDFQVADQKNRRPIHFAAACEELGPLKYLMSRGANMFDADSNGWIPLHYAINANRFDNVEYLLKLANDDKNPIADPYSDKYGKGSINRPTKTTKLPLHLAASINNTDIINKLIEYGADVDSILGVTQMKLTPLMLACGDGHLDSVKCLIEKGADPEKTDRLVRTPLIHAALNGNTHVMSYLIHIGVNVNRGDSSNNKPLHYTSAYGWYFATKLLLDVECEVNVLNDWRTTPLSIAYEKEHIGIVHLLLEDGKADIDFQDDDGNNLISKAAQFPNTKDLLEQIEYLLKKKAVCTLKDNHGRTPLYKLADKNVMDPNTPSLKGNEESMKISVMIGKLMVSYGCDQHAEEENGLTALYAALQHGNVHLAVYLMKLGCQVAITTQPDTNLLDAIVQNIINCSFDLITPVINLLTNPPQTLDKKVVEELHDNLKIMAKQTNSKGFTPFLEALSIYLKYEDNINNSFIEFQTKLWLNMKQLVKFFLAVCEVKVDETPERLKSAPVHLDIKDEQNFYTDQKGKWTAVDFIASLECSQHEIHIRNALQTILSYYPPLNYIAMDGYTPLARAIQHNNLHFAKLLLKEDGAQRSDPNIAREKTKEGKVYKIPLLFETCFIGSHLNQEDIKKKIDIVGVLCRNGINVDSINEETGHHILHTLMKNDKSAASTEFCLNAINVMVRHGLHFNMTNTKKQTVMHVAFNRCSGDMEEDLEIEFYLLKKSSHYLYEKDNIGRIPLHYLFVKDQNHEDSSYMDPIELCRMALSYDNRTSYETDKFGKTLLHYAAFRGASMCCNFLVQRGAVINLKDNDGNTPLALAVQGRHDSCATLLVQQNADVDIDVITPSKTDNKLYWQWKPLIKSESENKPRKLFEMVLDNELNGMMFMLMDLPPNKAVDDISAIEMGLNCKKYGFVMRLFSTMNTKYSLADRIPSNNDRNLLHLVALVDDEDEQEWQMFVVQKLVNKKVLLTVKDEYKCTPLYYCLLRQKLRVADYLIKTQPSLLNIKLRDKYGRSLLAAFLWNYKDMDSVSESKDLVELLIEKENLNQLYDLPVVLENFGQNVTNGQTYWEENTELSVSPLIFAIIKDDFDLAKLLLDYESDVNFPDSKNRTPFMHAVKKNNLNLVKLLLDHSWNPNVNDVEAANTELAASFGFKPVSDPGTEETEEEVESAEKELYESVKKTSDVDVNYASNIDGYTVLHHFVNPLDSYKGATFNNEEMLYVLIKAGADLNLKNKDGDTPLDLAIESGTIAVAKMIQKYQNIEESDMYFDFEECDEVIDGVKFQDRCDASLFSQDANKMMEKLDPFFEDEEDEEMMETIIQPKICEQCNITDGKLVEDKAQGICYNILLTKVDVQNGNWGKYNFYQMQLLYQPAKDLYILFTRWGRIGDVGQYQRTPYQTESDAIKNFSSIFKAKTGNAWTEVKSFEHKPKKYNLVDAKWNKKHKSKKTVDISLDYSVTSQLPHHLQDIIKNMIENRIKNLRFVPVNKKIDEDVVVFGKIGENLLNSALQLLDKISLILKEQDEYKAQNSNINPDQILKYCEKISTLSSDYYQLLPRYEFAFEKISTFTSSRDLDQEMSLIRNLLNIETTTKILLAAMFHQKNINPMDYVYQAVGCKMELMDQNSSLSQYIMCSMKNDDETTTKIVGIYKINRNCEEERFKKMNIGNHKLLWHGSDISNFIGILHRGLIFNPYGVHMTHIQLYGKGIYFADNFHKSANYATSDSKIKLMILAEVALGNQLKCVGIKPLIKPYDSIMLQGCNYPNPAGNVCLPTGTTLCVGNKLTRSYIDEDCCYATSNEYIVFNEAQVCLRYMVVYTDT